MTKPTLYIGDMTSVVHSEQFRDVADLIITDPPYNIGQDYGSTFNDRQSRPAFNRWLASVAWSCYWLLRPHGTLFIMMGEKHTDDLGIILRQQCFTRRRLVVWYESFGVYQRRNFANCCRYLHYCVIHPKHFCFNAASIFVPSARQSKYGDKRANPSGKLPDNLFRDSRVCGSFNERIKGVSVPNQLPESLVNRIIKVCSNPGDVVCDPFTGTGTVAHCALSLDRRFLGFEINPNHALVACNRVKPLVTLSL